jgi:hypothetical protein
MAVAAIGSRENASLEQPRSIHASGWVTDLQCTVVNRDMMTGCIHCARAFLKIEASPSKGSFSFDEKGAVACNLDCAKVAYCGGQLTKLLSS